MQHASPSGFSEHTGLKTKTKTSSETTKKRKKPTPKQLKILVPYLKKIVDKKVSALYKKGGPGGATE